MKEIVFATNNPHKLQEIRQILGGRLKVLSLDDIGCRDDIPETAGTLEGNALCKTRWVKEKYGRDCFADDTGLEVRALGGAPGAFTARYAGEGCTPRDNVAKLLDALRGADDRRASFRTVIALSVDGREYEVEGRVDGAIADAPRGTEGFGYDPVFIPEDTGLTFAQMGPGAKNSISHRARATARLLQKLQQLHKI